MASSFFLLYFITTSCILLSFPYPATGAGWFKKDSAKPKTEESVLLVAGGGYSITLIKVGGSSITDKSTKESMKEEALDWFSRSVSNNVAPSFRAVANDDHHSSSCLNENNETTSSPSLSAFVIVHGAGSFGHHTAKEFGLEGKKDPPPPFPGSSSSPPLNETERRYTMEGLARTRLSVQTLNRNVVSSLISHGVNAVGISPCFGVPALQAHGGGPDTLTALQNLVETTLRAGLIPVLHGDACLYGQQHAGILSGDVLMEMLGKAGWVSRAIFLTDVDGVHARDPNTDPNAELLREIAVSDYEIQSIELDASGSSHDHDVTGGLKTKLQSALSIAMLGKNVTITRCGSKSAEQVLQRQERVDRATVLYPRSSSGT